MPLRPSARPSDFVGGYVGLHYGWQHAFGLVGIPGLLLAIGYWFTRDYKTVPLEGPLAAGAPKSGGLGISVKGLCASPPSGSFIWPSP